MKVVRNLSIMTHETSLKRHIIPPTSRVSTVIEAAIMCPFPLTDVHTSFHLVYFCLLFRLHQIS